MRSAAEKEVLFQSWIEQHRGIIVKVIRSFADAPADADDLRQEILLQLWLSLATYAAQAKPSTWVYRVCLNTSLTWRRGTRRRERHFDSVPEGDVQALAGPASSPAKHADDREMLEQLYAAIRALPDSDRALILLSLDGLAYREIAEITGLTENHVGVALTRARKRLAAFLKGVTDELE